MLFISDGGGTARAGETRHELIMGILESPWMKGTVLWPTTSIGRSFLMGGTGRGVLQCRGRYTDLKPLVRAPEESCALWAEREGKQAWRRAVGRFTSDGSR